MKSPSQVNFLVFTSIWTLLATTYLLLTPMYLPRAAHKFVIVAIEAITMIFWFAGFIALAVFLSSLSLCVGNVCKSAVAATVFGAFEWYVRSPYLCESSREYPGVSILYRLLNHPIFPCLTRSLELTRVI